MSRTKRVLLAMLVVLMMIQFIRPAANSSDVIKQSDIITHFNVHEDVANILNTSCYDCHSNNTHYPWYAHIQPFGWILARHIRDGKQDLNFSDFAGYSKRRQVSKLKSVRNSIRDGSMPLSSYTLLHKNAKLSGKSKALLIQWTSKTIDSLSGGRE